MAKCKNCKQISYSKTEDGDRFPWCPKFNDSPDVEDERDCIYYEIMSQADKIRNMTDGELTEFLVEHHRHPCKYCLSCWTETESAGGCREELMRWLKSEVEE